MEEQNTQMTQAETLAQMMAADMEERKKALYRHKMPAQNLQAVAGKRIPGGRGQWRIEGPEGDPAGFR